MRIITFILLFAFNSFTLNFLTEGDLGSFLSYLPEKNDKFKYMFKLFNINNLYKLFIDKERLNNPEESEIGVKSKYLFDVFEPGYYQAMKKAFLSLPHYIGKPISLDMIVELHDLAVDNVLSNKTDMQKGIEIGAFSYKINNRPEDRKALKESLYSNILYNAGEICNKILKEPLWQKYHLENHEDVLDDFKESEYLISNFLSKITTTTNIVNKMEKKRAIEIISIERELDDLKIKIQPFIQHYYNSIEWFYSFKDKLRAIAELLRALEIAHFLPDGNQRTYSFLLLNKLLLENGLPFAILDDPAMFDGYLTVEDMADDIEQGIINFLNECSSKKIKKAIKKQNKKKNKNELIYDQNDYVPYFIKNKENYKKLISNFKNEITDNNYIILNKINHKEFIITEEELLDTYELALEIGALRSACHLFERIINITDFKNIRITNILLKIKDLTDAKNIKLLEDEGIDTIDFKNYIFEMRDFFSNQIDPQTIVIKHIDLSC